MSRQQVKHGKYIISFGWDRSFDTYFAQVEFAQIEDADDDCAEPLLWLGSERGEYRDLETFQQSLAQGLLSVGINEFELNEQQLSELQAARDASPPGVGIAEKNPAMRDLMNLFDDE